MITFTVISFHRRNRSRRNLRDQVDMLSINFKFQRGLKCKFQLQETEKIELQFNTFFPIETWPLNQKSPCISATLRKILKLHLISFCGNFCGKTQFPQSSGQFTRNSIETK